MRRGVFPLAFFLLATIHMPVPGGVPWTPSQIAAIAQHIDAELRAPVLRGAQIGFTIVDTVRGNTLYARNATQEFMPASNFKLLVGSTALAHLPMNFAYVTTIAAGAPAQDGTIAGNLYLRGGGDAQLHARDLEAAAAALAAQGVRRIDGALVTDATRYAGRRYPSGWEWDDLPYYWAPVVSALELDDGTVHLTMTPSTTVGAPVILRVWPQSDAFTIRNDLRTGMPGSHDTSALVRPWDAPMTIELTGSYPQGAGESGDLEPTVPDPPHYAGEVLARALAEHGITIADGVRSGQTPAAAIALWRHESEPLPQLLARMWLPSDNLMAELLLDELGTLHSGDPGRAANGIALEREYLRSIGVDPATVSITDGSGLSIYDRITPQDLVAILQADWNSPYRQSVLDALPVAGVRGTMKDAYLGTPAQGTVFAKSGTMTHVTTLSGYVQTRTHGPVTFSFLINQWLGDDTPGGNAQLARVRAAIFSLLSSS